MLLKFLISHQRGSSILANVCSTCVGSLVALTASLQLGADIRSKTAANDLYEKYDLQDSILQRVDCAGTLPTKPSACGVNGYISLKGFLGSAPVEIAAIPIEVAPGQFEYSKWRDWALRVSCVACPKCSGGFQIQVEASKNPTAPKPKWKNVFDKIPLSCSIPLA